MPVLKAAGFAGEKPLISARLLPDMAATEAFNVRLNDGALTPVNKSVFAGFNTPNASHATIYRHKGAWLSWAGDVAAAPGPVADDRLYYMGDGAPKVRIGSTDYPLAVPRPGSALGVALAGTGSGDIQSRTYTFTWVTDFGEESAPAPASSIIDWKPGNTVTLSGFPAIPAGRAITKQRIYRSQTSSSGTKFYLIHERSASTSSFSDTVAVDAIQEPIASTDWNAPPDALKGLTALPNGMMAAFKGKDVYFCEPWRPHAWPEKYIETCDYDIVGLRSIGSTLVVMTSGQPYIMSGAHPDSMQSMKVEANFPCINSRGIVDLGFAICYPSNSGLIAVRGDGSVTVATSELFDREKWTSFSPKTIVAAQHAGNYVMFYNTLDPDGAPMKGAVIMNVNAAQYLVRSKERASAVFYSLEDEALYFKRPGETGVYRFDAPDGTPETLYWKSKEFWLNTPTNFGAVLIDLGLGLSLKGKANIAAEIADIAATNAALFAAGSLLSSIDETPIAGMPLAADILRPYPFYNDLLMNIYADGNLVASIASSGQVKRLPSGFKARCWAFDISSNVQVSQVIVAGTVDEIQGAM